MCGSGGRSRISSAWPSASCGPASSRTGEDIGRGSIMMKIKSRLSLTKALERGHPIWAWKGTGRRTGWRKGVPVATHTIP
eukprot:4087293-Pyramimonas_sp.AAC.1